MKNNSIKFALTLFFAVEGIQLSAKGGSIYVYISGAVFAVLSAVFAYSTIKGYLKDKYEENKNTNESMSAFLSDLKSSLTENTALIREDISQSCGLLARKIEEATSETSSNIIQVDSGIDRLIKESSRAVKNVQSELTQNNERVLELLKQLIELKRDNTAQVLNMNENTITSVHELLNGINTNFTNTNEYIKNLFSGLQSKISSDFTKDYECSIESLKALDGLCEKINNSIGEQKNDLECLSKNLNDLVDTSERQIRKNIGKLIESLEQYESGLSSNMERLSAEYKVFETFVNSIVDKMTSVSKEDIEIIKEFLNE
jgi:hypothetical protein